MEGAGGTYTPTVSTRLLVFFEWDVQIVGASTANEYVCNFGTGSAPVNGAAHTGTQIGRVLTADITAAHFSHVGIIAVAVGTTYWFDWGASNNDNATLIYVFNPVITLVEL
jgi:hypothetical protein